MPTNSHWASIWGNAVSIAENRPERYAKNITLRYPIHVPFSGNSIRLTFDNYVGTEPVTMTKTTVFYGGRFYPVLFRGGDTSLTLRPGERVTSDPLELDVKAKLDGEYAAALNGGHGFAMDLKCFFGTIKSVLKSDGVVEGGTGATAEDEEQKVMEK